MSEYTEQAEKFLKDAGLEFRAVLIGSDCPTFCPEAEKQIDMDKVDVYPRRTHIHGKHYRCTLSRKGRGHVSFDFWNSYADEEYNALGTKSYRLGEHFRKYERNGKRTPTAYDLLACLQKSDPGMFENFCDEFGYDYDSRKAEQTYHAVQQEWRKIQRFFTPAEIEALQEIS